MHEPVIFTPAAGICPEAELLLCCARTHLDSGKVERISALLHKDLNWTYLLKIAARHGLLPLLYWHLKAIGSTSVPPAQLNYLQARFHANATRNLLLTNELLRLLRLFQEAAIPAVPYKGPVLALSVYEDIALRQFTDLDILVRQQDIPKCRDLMLAQGYRQEGHPEYADEFVSGDGTIGVEIHWQLTGFAFSWQGTTEYHTFPMDYESLCGRLQSISLEGVPVSNLSPEDLFLFLCVHGSKHAWERIGWICDVAQLLQTQPEMDWSLITERARALGCERMLALGLHLVRELLGGHVPEPPPNLQSSPVIKSLAAQVVRRLFLEPEPAPRRIEDALFALQLRNRWRDKLPCCIHYARLTFVPTERDRAALALPPFLRGFYYLLRPVRLMAQGGVRAARHLFQRLLPKRR